MSYVAKAPGSILGAGEKAPLVIQDPERARRLEELRNLVGKKFAQKFKTVRQAFQFVDVERKGNIIRKDIHRLWVTLNLHRNFGWTDLSYADDFYDLLNLDGNEEIDFHEFQAFAGPYIHPGHCANYVSASDPDSGAYNHYQKGKFYPIEHHEDVKDNFTTTYDNFKANRNNAHAPSGLVPGYGGFVPRAPPGMPRLSETPDVPIFQRNSIGSSRRGSQDGLDMPLSRRDSLSARRGSVGADVILSARRGSNANDEYSTRTPWSAPELPWVGQPPPSSAHDTLRTNSIAPLPSQATKGPVGAPEWPPQNQVNVLRRLNEAAMTVGSGLFTALPRRRSID